MAYIEAEISDIIYDWTEPEDPVDGVLKINKKYHDIKIDPPGWSEVQVKVNQQELSTMINLTGSLMKLTVPYNDESKNYNK